MDPYATAPDRRRFLTNPATIAGLYALAATLWIVFSDRLAAVMAESAAHVTALQTHKGGAFVLLTTALLFLLLRSGRRAEDALRDRIENQARQYLSLFAANPLPMWVSDRDSLAFLAVNDAAVEHYGYSRDEFLGMTIADIRPAEDIEALRANVAAVKGGLDHAGIWRHRRKGGDLIEVEITSSALSFEGRRAELVLARDVTAERSAQRRVAEAEERLRLALDAAGQGLYDLDVQTGEFRINDGYAAMLGYAPGELVETNAAWIARLHPQDRERVARVYGDYVAGRLPEYRVEFRQRTKRGNWKWILSLGRVMERNADGTPRRMLGTHTDIDAEKQAQARIRRLTNLYAALSQSNQAIVRIRDRGQLLAEVCRIAVDYGGLRMAWVGEIEDGVMIPTARFGARTDYVDGLRLAGDDPSSHGPTVTAVREDRHVICDDIESDPAMAPWREEALGCGFRASAAFPLSCDGRPVGSLNLYAPEARFFDEELVALLDELALDVSFGLDRFRIEAQQVSAERRFRTLVDHAADAIFVSDMDGRIVDANAAASISLGYTREELLGRSIADLDPVAAAMESSGLRRLLDMTMEDRQVILARHRRKDGSTFPVEVRAAGVRLPDGDFVIGMVRDISERQRAEQALRESEQRFRLISQAISDIVYSCRLGDDGQFEIDWMLGAAERITGYTIEELMPRRCWRCLVVAEDMEIFRQRVTGLTPGTSASCELRLTRKDGGIVWVASSAECIADSDDPADHRLYGGLTDISGRKHAEQALRDSEARLRRVVEEMPVLLDAFDETGLVVHWNRECERVTGYRAEEIIGNPHAMELLYPDADYRDRMLALWRQRGHDYRNWEWTLTARDGSPRHVAWSNVSHAVPIPGWPAWGVGVDLTPRRAAEAALAEYAKRLQSLSRQLLEVQEEERRALARELHDEVGQQLAALKLNLTMLRPGVAAADAHRLADSIDITNLTIERIRDTALNLRPSVLDDLGLASALHWYVRRQAERANCRIEVHAEVPPLPGDVESALFRIAQEAVNNAIRHGAARHIDIALEMRDNAVQLRVEDDGTGFDVSARASGSMGLLGMRERAELLGGRFVLDSRPGAGTRVQAEIPLDSSTHE